MHFGGSGCGRSNKTTFKSRNKKCVRYRSRQPLPPQQTPHCIHHRSLRSIGHSGMLDIPQHHTDLQCRPPGLQDRDLTQDIKPRSSSQKRLTWTRLVAVDWNPCTVCKAFIVILHSINTTHRCKDLNTNAVIDVARTFPLARHLHSSTSRKAVISVCRSINAADWIVE